MSKRKVIGFYTDEKKRKRPITAKKGKAKLGVPKKTLFFPPKSKKWSEIIRIDTPEGAKYSTKILLEEFEKAKTRSKKRRLKRYAVLAMNRAEVISQNKRVSPKERADAKKVVKIYKEAIERMKIE